jgi:dihydrofolate reductase
MRKLIVTEFVSLDGVMQAPGGEPGYAHSGWVGPRFSDELGAYKLQEQLAADILLLGRITYESFYGAWPLRDGPMAEKINTMTKRVVSTTLGSSDWQDTTVISGDLGGAIGELKAQDGGPILVAGSRTLVHALLAAGLVDQLNLQVFPLLLGSGARVYPDSPTLTRLTLASSEALPNGVVLQSYLPEAGQ